MSESLDTDVAIEAEAPALNRLQRLGQSFDELTASVRAPFEKLIADLIAGIAATPKPSDAPAASASTYDKTPSSSTGGYLEDLKKFF